MGGPKDYTEQSKSERQIAYDITYMWNLTHDTNEYLQKRDLQTSRTDLWLPRGRDEFGISRNKLFYIGWISKVLLCSTGNCIQYSVIKP